MKLYNIAVSAAQNFASTSKRKGASREFARVPNGELAALLPGEPGRRRRRVGRRVRRRGGGDGPDHVGAAIAARSRPRAASDHRGVLPGMRPRGARPIHRRRLPPVHTLERVATRRGCRRGGGSAHGHTESDPAFQVPPVERPQCRVDRVARLRQRDRGGGRRAAVRVRRRRGAGRRRLMERVRRYLFLPLPPPPRTRRRSVYASSRSAVYRIFFFAMGVGREINFFIGRELRLCNFSQAF